MIPDHGNRLKRRTLFKSYLLNLFNLSELNIKFLIKHLRSVAGKLIEIKEAPENLFISPQGT